MSKADNPRAVKGNNRHGLTASQVERLRVAVKRLETLDVEHVRATKDRRDIFSELKELKINTRAVKDAMRRRRLDTTARQEREREAGDYEELLAGLAVPAELMKADPDADDEEEDDQ